MAFLFPASYILHIVVISLCFMVIGSYSYIFFKPEVLIIMNIYWTNCVKYGRTWFFFAPYFRVLGQNLRFCPYTGKYVSDKTRIQGYYTQCHKIKGTSKIYLSHALISLLYVLLFFLLLSLLQFKVLILYICFWWFNYLNWVSSLTISTSITKQEISEEMSDKYICGTKIEFRDNDVEVRCEYLDSHQICRCNFNYIYKAH